MLGICMSLPSLSFWFGTCGHGSSKILSRIYPSRDTLYWGYCWSELRHLPHSSERQTSVVSWTKYGELEACFLFTSRFIVMNSYIEMQFAKRNFLFLFVWDREWKLLSSNFSVAIISVALTLMYCQEAVSTISCSDTYFLFCEWTLLSLVYIHCWQQSSLACIYVSSHLSRTWTRRYWVCSHLRTVCKRQCLCCEQLWQASILLNASPVNQTQANAGNSRAEVSVRGRSKPLSTKHMPVNECKQSRNISTPTRMKFDLKWWKWSDYACWR